MSNWKKPYQELPEDEQEVFIRIHIMAMPPAKAVYNASTVRFEIESLGLSYPAGYIGSWRAVEP